MARLIQRSGYIWQIRPFCVENDVVAISYI
jgi:hypothetical protein